MGLMDCNQGQKDCDQGQMDCNQGQMDCNQGQKDCNQDQKESNQGLKVCNQGQKDCNQDQWGYTNFLGFLNHLPICKESHQNNICNFQGWNVDQLINHKDMQYLLRETFLFLHQNLNGRDLNGQGWDYILKLDCYEGYQEKVRKLDLHNHFLVDRIHQC